nr:PAS domain-containing protein [Panacagrimonas sp.]
MTEDLARSDAPVPTAAEWRALVAREREQRALLSNIAGMVYRGYAEPPWQFTYVSDGVEGLTGYSPSFFLEEGHRWAEIMVQEDVEPVARQLSAQAQEGREVRVEYRIRCRDGSIRWVDGRVRTFPGEPSIYSGTVFDIDERKRAEQAFAESQEHQRFIIESVPATLWTAHPNGDIEFISSAGKTYVGASIEQRVGYGWLDFVHPEDAERVRNRWRRSLETGELYEVGFRQGDLRGGYRWLQARGICRRDAHGRIVRWYGTTTDVTQLVHTQAQLHDSEELASATMQTVPGIVWRADPNGTLTFISDACEAQLGWTAAEVMGNRWLELVHQDDAPALAALWGRALKTGDAIDTRYRVRNRQGAHRWHQVRAIAGRDAAGNVTRWNGLAIDIEDLLQARWAAESAVRAKSAFLSTMSHEIRTPLNAVLGYAGLLSDTALGAEQRDFVNGIRASGDHLLGVINDILDFSKMESGHLALDFADCDLRQLLESALDIVASQAAARQIELLYRIAEGVPALCHADPARLKQVLLNLLGNAVKFTTQGEIEVSVTARPLTPDEWEFEFAVRDTGVGIPTESLNRLFRDFSQLDDTVSRRYGGTGLGLAISKRLVEAHGGCIRVTSQPDRGSTFTFVIPSRRCASERMFPFTPHPGLKGRHVLIVDDNVASLDSLRGVFRSWGFDVTLADANLPASPRVPPGLDGGSPATFDLAVLDHPMPFDRDLQLVRRLRQARPSVPVLLMTSLGTSLDPDVVAAAGVTATLSKPLHQAALYETVCRSMGVGAATTDTPTSPPPTSPDRMPPLRLLLAEDNMANRKVAQLLLRKMGYSALDVATNGREAVDAVQARIYDVVLMDVQMPELDGLDATRRIRREVPLPLQPQILALTANATAEDREACLRAGMDGYLSKPIDPVRLAHALRAAAERLERRHVDLRNS